MDNLSVKLTWIDGLQQEYLLATVEVSAVVVWAELGQLEGFGKKLSSLPKKGVGASCELNAPELA